MLKIFLILLVVPWTLCDISSSFKEFGKTIVEFVKKLELLLKFGCGIKQISKPSSLIINGVQSYHGEHPWLASLQVKHNGIFKNICGASLINEWSLVTAAHCVQGRRQIKVILGRYDLNDATELHGVERDVSEILIHPNYFHQADNRKSDSDIAVLIMEHPVTFTNYIIPICLPSAFENVFNIDGIVVGRGRTSLSSAKTSPVPLKAHVESITRLKCYDDYDGVDLILSKSGFCAVNDRQAPCQGDSGGPFLIHHETTSKWTILGIVSYAISDECRVDGFTVFVNVPMFTDWIKSNMKN